MFDKGKQGERRCMFTWNCVRERNFNFHNQLDNIDIDDRYCELFPVY